MMVWFPGTVVRLVMLRTCLWRSRREMAWRLWLQEAEEDSWLQLLTIPDRRLKKVLLLMLLLQIPMPDVD